MKQLVDLIGKRVKVFGHFGDVVMAEGEVIGVYDHPSVIVQGADGRQSTHSSHLRIEEIVPPLPEEPPDGTDLAAGGVISSRRDGWGGSSGEKRWYSTDCSDTLTWAEVLRDCGEIPLERLIPDPADSAPELPWHMGSCGGTSVFAPRPTRDDTIRMVIRVEENDFTADEAEQIGSAILRAVREARR